MKVVIFTVDEPMYLPRYLEPVLEAHSESIAGIVDAPAADGGLGKIIQERFRMFGPVTFMRYGVRFATAKILGWTPSRFDHSLSGRYHSLRNLATGYDIPVRTVSDINDPAFVREIEDLDPSLLLSISCRQKFRQPLLSLDDCEFINLHGSLLPEYRGRATAFWVLYNDESASGVTAHRMTESFDGGQIVDQRRFPIKDDDSMADVYEKIVDVGSKLAVDVIDTHLHGSFDERENEVETGDYYSLPGPAERREFRDRGNDFL